MQVLADSMVVIESQTGIHRQPLAERHSIGSEQGTGVEFASVDGRIGGDGLKGVAVVVHVPDTGRNDDCRAMVALFDLRAYLPLVIGSKKTALVVAQCRLDRR